MSKDKILFIVEGKVAEPKVINSILRSMGYQENQIYSYKTNIYSLYSHLMKEYGDEKDYDLFSFICELELQKDKKDQDSIVQARRNEFSAIYLFFDLDAHNIPGGSKFSGQRPDVKGNIEKVQKLVETFDNESELGKLYISYPMVESLTMYHRICYDKICFYKFKAGTNKSKNGKKFKTICNGDIRSHLLSDEFSEKDIEWLKIYHLLLCREIFEIDIVDYQTFRSLVETRTVLSKQYESVESNELIYVYSGIAEWVLNYIKEDVFPDITPFAQQEVELINKWEES